MSMQPRQAVEEFDLERARQDILRYQPASNWVSISLDPTPRMTIGFGFDMSRPEAAAMLTQVGADPAAVRSGRAPISDAQMEALFDLALLAAAESAQRHVPGFSGMRAEQQLALLELIMWLGHDNTETMFGELEQLSLPLLDAPLEPSPWFDTPPATSRTQRLKRTRRRWLRAGRNPRSSASRCRTTFESFGVLAELVSDDRDLLRAAESMLPPGWRTEDGRPSVRFGLWRDGWITVNGVRTVRAPQRKAALLRLGSAVRHHVATEAHEFTFVHAGVVEVGGCGIVIPGRSYTGKSTLVAELVRLGATYVSDEYAVLDPSGLVQPFAKPLSIRSRRRDPLGELVAVPQERVAEQPVRADLIVLTSYAPEAHWRPSVGSRAEGAFALLQNTVSARLRPACALSAARQLAQSAVVLVGQRGEASDTARAMLEAALLGSEAWNTFPA
jgi:hypothetical protein